MKFGMAVMGALSFLGCAADRLEVRESPHAALVARHHLAEGDTGKPDAPAASSAEAPAAPVGDLPDPAPLTERVQYQFTLHYLNGDIEIEQVERVQLERARVTPRRMGRFAFELWIGRELIERVRFDFPLLAAEPSPSEQKPGVPGLAARADVRHKVSVPHSDRATRAHLVDRATGELIVVPWPPAAAETSPSEPIDTPKVEETP